MATFPVRPGDDVMLAVEQGLEDAFGVVHEDVLCAGNEQTYKLVDEILTRYPTRRAATSCAPRSKIRTWNSLR